MKKELIECAKNYLEYPSIGNASKLRAAIEQIESSIDSSQHETSKVITNEKAKEVCIHEDTCETYQHDPDYKCSECPFREQTG